MGPTSIPAGPVMAVAKTIEIELLPEDTCDHCGPAVAANTAVRLLSGGMLTLCTHHYNVHAPALVPFLAAVKQNAVK